MKILEAEESFANNPGHNIWMVFDALSNFLVTSEKKHDYQQ